MKWDSVEVEFLHSIMVSGTSFNINTTELQGSSVIFSYIRVYFCFKPVVDWIYLPMIISNESSA